MAAWIPIDRMLLAKTSRRSWETMKAERSKARDVGKGFLPALASIVLGLAAPHCELSTGTTAFCRLAPVGMGVAGRKGYMQEVYNSLYGD